ncbi:hypothetical protein KFL_001270080 [Klebsormidium nitens]|uniref:Uncharacterized protein n=1 Tax=Klebsormidium nitens TaxID=105231 RepID=A0A1Y1HW57_KLENI|nr:hypothetical protein KFL_001270080 [Klebsormidium nitens]|eukprot:GAQ82865.1 hypothetical protein KFL_001270080 [Klebsormidium nitens]
MSGPKQKKVLASLPGAGPEPIFESARFQSRFRVFTILFTIGATCALVTSDFGDRDHVFSGVKRLIGQGLDRLFQLDEKDLEEVHRRAAEKRARGGQL